MTTHSSDFWDNLDKRLAEGREKTARRKRIAAAERAVIQAAGEWRDAGNGPKRRTSARVALWEAVDALREALL